MVNKFKKELKIKDTINNKYISKKIIDKYPNLETIKIDKLFNMELDIDIENKINKIILLRSLTIPNQNNYQITNIKIKRNYLTTKCKTDYELITQHFHIFNNLLPTIVGFKTNIEYIKIKDEWIKDNTIIIPACDNINNIDLTNKNINKPMTLDLRNVKNVNNLIISSKDYMDTIIVNFDQNIKIYMDKNEKENFKIIFDKDNEINYLDKNVLELEFNKKDGKFFKSIQNNNSEKSKQYLIKYDGLDHPYNYTFVELEKLFLQEKYMTVSDDLNCSNYSRCFKCEDDSYKFNRYDNIDIEYDKNNEKIEDEYRRLAILNKPIRQIVKDGELNEFIYYRKLEFYLNNITCKNFNKLKELKDNEKILKKTI